ncbi:MAG: DUF2934 domain-containing protein [Methyloprofundus sp.]|nr:DUF2934 domain-containing protein [Methyloprofundus sp.]MDT8425392.1 DUF2934 domain-containing protein [Methyloprofundus sp.]
MTTNKKNTEPKAELLENPIRHYISDEDYYDMIARCAYYKAEQRGFVAGDELEDWYAAEQEVNKQNFYRFLT